MTIAKTDARKQYSGDDVTTAFAFPFRFFADSDLQVFILVVSTGVETLQTLTTHYTVSNNDDETGGTVTMLTEPAAGEKLTILRAIPQTQGTDYAANDAFPAETHEAALDRLTLLVQQLQEESSRALVAPVSDTASLELPIDRASSFLAFDASKNPIASAGTTGSSDIIVSTFMETVLDDTTALIASQTLELEKGVDVQTHDDNLDTVAGGSAANATAVTNLTGTNSGDEIVATTSDDGIMRKATNAEMVGGVTANVYGDSIGVAAAIAALANLGAPFNSSGQTITSSGMLTLAHGLGAKPRLIEFYMICTTTDGTWAVGNEIIPNMNSSTANTTKFNGISYDTTNVYIHFDDASKCFTYVVKGGGTSSELVNASWDFYVRAWK